MNLKIIFAPLLLSTMMDYTTTSAMTVHESILLQKQQLFALNAARLILYIYSQGYSVTLGECLRTTEQAQIYAKEGLGITHSKHCERLALDLNLFDKDGKFLHDGEAYKIMGLYWQSLSPHNISGAFWTHRPDLDHFEMD